MWEPTESYVASAAQEFFDSAVRWPRERVELFSCLADYIRYWVEERGGHKQCGNDFASFQTVVVVIIHLWMTATASNDPADQVHEFVEEFRRVFPPGIDRVLPRCEVRHDILEKLWFDYHVANA
jgi:hypothetical protein